MEGGIVARLLKMKITTQDKRGGGCRHRKENGSKAGKLISLGDGMIGETGEKE